MIMTYHELVKKVQTALAKADASKVEEHIAVQVNVTGEAEGAFYMEISGGVLYVAPYDYNDRDALLTGDGADVLAVAQGKVSLEAAIADGKLAHEGDYEKALVLGATIPAKKTPGRKPAAKAEENAPAAAPKKRGRKPKNAVTETAAPADAPAPKKRGRKPKNAVAEVAAPAPVVEEATPVVEEVAAPAPVVEEVAPAPVVEEVTAPVVEEAAPAPVAEEAAPAEAPAPKKRGRKPGSKKAADKAVPAEAPKKRGRKPGAKKAASTDAPKKRGRKPTKK